MKTVVNMRQFIETVIGYKKDKKIGRNNLIDADCKIKCPVRKITVWFV